MNRRQSKTLSAVFAEPTPANLAWNDVESLLVSVGCKIVEGSGSRVTFVHEKHVESFHRPHPAKEAKRYQIRQAKAFLIRMGVQP